MILAMPDMVAKIDEYAVKVLGVPMRELMLRAGRAVADAVTSHLRPGSSVLILAGKGNNGGDGYAAATLLMQDFDVTVYDVFDCGQRSDEGRFFRDNYICSGGKIEGGFSRDSFHTQGCIVDAIFGTGFKGSYPDEVKEIAAELRAVDGAIKVAIDVPLGVNASDGSIDEEALYRADITVALGFVKPGLISYPAKEYVGKLIYDNIGLQNEEIISKFEFESFAIDRDTATLFIPSRPLNSNKGSFGKAALITGSSRFPGAARLSLEAALRSGAGLTAYLGEKELSRDLCVSFPEAIYHPISLENFDEKDIAPTLDFLSKYSAILIGSGSSKTRGVSLLTEALLASDGQPVVLDADAINLLSENPERGRALIRASRRPVIMTPHPLELSRISGIPTAEIQSRRLSVAKSFAAENNCILVLKGAGTIVTDGKTIYINTTGSSALAKAGSGDVLAGALTSLVASGVEPMRAAALSVYFHGLAADILADELSELGVTPSDLPREIARQIKKAILNE